MNVNEIAEKALDLNKLVDGVQHFRGGGNMGMMFIAQAIETHARSVDRLAAAIESVHVNFHTHVDCRRPEGPDLAEPL